MTGTSPQAGRKEWIALAALTLPPFVVSMDITVLYFAVPSMAADLNPSSTQQLWMIDIYGFVLAAFLITMGNIGDIIGRRRMLLIGSAVFGAASAAVAFSTSTEMLIAARAVQGLAASTLMPSALALVRNVFHDERQRRSAIAIWSVGVAAGVSVAPIVSGALLNSFWWGSIFLINVPVIAVLLILIPLLVPELRLPRVRTERFDVLSSLLSLFAVFALVWGFKEITANGFGALSAAGVAAGLALAAVFVVRQARLPHPMIDTALFAHRGFGPALALTFTAFFCVIGFGLFSTQYLLEVLSMGPLEAGLWFLVIPVLTGVCAPVAANLVGRVRPAYVIAGAFLVVAAGFTAMSQLTLERDLLLTIGGIAAIGVGVSTVIPLLTDMVVSVSPEEQAGSVAALQRTFQELGGAFGIALFGSVGAAVYSREFAAGLSAGPVAEVPPGAYETVGAATAAASRLPAEDGSTLLAVAREAFTGSLNLGAAVGVGVALAAAVFTLLRLRHISYAGEKEEAAVAEPEPAGVEAEPAPVAD
ncbi:MFS transporter [Planomonospora parontospora]|uniref:MFS transporter n=1 Tax=Planomonospora parontospora TaxID=58119 RepID=UPI00167015EA|nr:MFS transporter [Planomonospora parontospora]GGL53621.1 MFS transporter [Planomonospora parontospora subsp. antibiotica]GII19595.1 MFS transporter [Planomonospora parontospora subsp. antibiotica]